MGKMTSNQASQKKELGHAEERTFNAFFGDKNKRETNFSGSSPDNEISNIQYQKDLIKELGKFDSFKVSLKSGDTWTFHLGRIDELSDLKQITIGKTLKNETKVIHSLTLEEQKLVLLNKDFWQKYLGKGDLLCYNDKRKKYTFFRMDSVIEFICNNVEWRLLETGRIKGDIVSNNKRRAVLTFEYRDIKKQFALGAMSGKNGLVFFEILKHNLKYHEVEFDVIFENNSNIKLFKRIYKIGLKGKIGETFFDSNYFYMCTEENTWKKIKLENII